MNKLIILKAYTIPSSMLDHYNRYLYYNLLPFFKRVPKPPHFFHKKSLYISNYYKKL